MGKAKRQLNAARKEIFDGLRVKDAAPASPPTDPYLDALERESFHRQLVIDAAFRTRSMIFSYVENNMYPLCEFLDLDNLINYIEWLLNRPR